MTSLQPCQFSIPSQAPSEVTQSKDFVHIDEVRTFACRADDVPSFLIENPYHHSGLLAPVYEPMNFSCSQQTTITSVSRENSFKARTPPALMPIGGVPNDSRKGSFAEKLRKCTQKVLNFQMDANSTPIPSPTANENVSYESSTSAPTVSNSSFKETRDEDSELSQMMFEVNNEVHARNS